MSQMLKSSGLMGFATFLSRMLGLVREQVYAHFMGDGGVASAFRLAFQIPNLFRRLLGEGALTAAFIPIFKEKEKREGDVEMWRAANAVISGLVVATAVVVGLVMLGITAVLILSSVHTTKNGAVFPLIPLQENTRLMLQLLRIMFPYLLLVCLAALCMGMLNSRGHFFIPAMGATMLNIVMISTVLFLTPHFGKTLETQIFALAVGVLAAGTAQFAFQLPTLHREGFRYHWVRPWGDPTVRQVVRKMAPAAVGVAAFQINVLVIQCVAFFVDQHIVASFDYAVRLMEFPQGIVGISLATYLLPTLAGMAAERNYGEFRSTLRQGLGYLVFINLIASVLLVCLAEPIVRLLFEHGEFTRDSTYRASLALACLAPGLVAFSVVNVLARAFYALGDTQTPMKISLACLAANLVVSLWLVGPYRQAGLGVANSLSSLLNVYLLLHALRKKLKSLEMETLVRPVLLSLGAALLAGAAAYGARHWWTHQIGHATFFQKAGEVFVPMGIAGLVYWGGATLFHVPQAAEMTQMVRGLLRRKGNAATNN